MKKLIGRLALALSLATGLGAAHAAPTVIDFDGGLDDSLLWFPPFVTHGDFMVQGDYFVGTASTKSVADRSSSTLGSTADSCRALASRCASSVLHPAPRSR